MYFVFRVVYKDMFLTLYDIYIQAESVDKVFKKLTYGMSFIFFYYEVHVYMAITYYVQAFKGQNHLLMK